MQKKKDTWKVILANRNERNKKHLRALNIARFQIFWQPKQDVTAYETAIALPYIFRDNRYLDYPTMPEAIRRHFIIKQLY